MKIVDEYGGWNRLENTVEDNGGTVWQVDTGTAARKLLLQERT